MDLTSVVRSSKFHPDRLVPPNSWVGHIPFASWLMQTLGPSVFVELGTHTGNSYFAFCQACKEAGLASKCYAVDTWEGDEHAGYYGGAVFEGVYAHNQEKYEAFSRLLRMTFDEAVHYFSDGSIDLLHIDGLHTYEAVKHDFETWLPKLSGHAVVLFHDTNVRERGFGVWQFWGELVQRYPLNLEFVHSHGLGVLQLASGSGSFDLTWLERGSADQRLLVDYFSSRGADVARQCNITELRDRLGELEQARLALEAQVKELEGAVAERGELLAVLNQLLGDRDEQIEGLFKELEDRDGNIIELRDRLGEWEQARLALEAQVKELEGAVAERGELLAGLNQLLGDRDEQIEGLFKELEDRDGNIADLNEAQAAAEAAAAAIRNSTTWRATEPLRNLLTQRPGLRSLGRRSARLLRRLVVPRPVTVVASLEQMMPPGHGGEAVAADSAGDSIFGDAPPAEPTQLRIRGSGPSVGSRSENGSSKPLIIVLSHVRPWPPRAGNEYRLHRLLNWLDASGWDPVLLYCPLPGDAASADDGNAESDLAAMAARHRNIIWVYRDGVVLHSLTRVDILVALYRLDKRWTRDLEAPLGETPKHGAARLLNLVRAFCPDVLVEVLLGLSEQLSPRAVIATYVFMTRGLPLLARSTLRIVDTIDVFSTKSEKVEAFGIRDDLAISRGEESALLSPADLVLAIQSEEAKDLEQIAPNRRVITVGVDMDVIDAGAHEWAPGPTVLMVGSGNPMNVKGIRDFLRFVWPRVKDALPDAQFNVVGSVGEAISNQPLLGVHCLGRVDDLTELYASARVVINPAVAGTGLKIKTIEALAHLRPIVLWPSGTEGVPPELCGLCEIATDWFAFSEGLIRLLSSEQQSIQPLMAARERIAELLSSQSAYGELGRVLEQVVREGGGGS